MNSQDNDNLNKLAVRMKKGDMKAGGKLFDYFSTLMFRFFVARTRSKEVSQDLTQDVFVKVVSKIDSFDENQGNFSSWIWQIAKNSLIDYYRVKKEVPFPEDDENFFGSYRIEDDIEDKAKIKDILSVVERFSEEEQEIFSLFYLSDLPYKEISIITGRSEGSLRVTIHRILLKIKKIINN